MSGPRGFIERSGEMYEIHRAGQKVSEAKGLKNTQNGTSRRYVGFLPGTSVEAGDLLVSMVSGDQFRVLEVESLNIRNSVEVVQAFYENERKHRTPSHAQPTNVISIGSVSHSAIQQGTDASTLTYTGAMDTEEKGRLEALVEEVLNRVDELEMPEADKEETKAQAQTIKAHLKTAKPRQSFVRECLTTIMGCVKKAAVAGATTAATTGAAMGATKLVEMIATHLK